MIAALSFTLKPAAIACTNTSLPKGRATVSTGAESQDVTINIFPSRHPYRLLNISSDAHVRRRNHDPLLCLTVETAEGYARGLSFQVDRQELKDVYANLSAFMRSFDFPKLRPPSSPTLTFKRPDIDVLHREPGTTRL